MPPLQYNSDRYEIKMVHDGLRIYEARQWIRVHPAAFSTAYPPRQVNNIYFDTADLDTYNDHVSGIGHRQKLRLRWYGQDLTRITNGVLEMKGKKYRLGSKIIYKFVGNIELDQPWGEILPKIKEYSEPLFSTLVAESRPVVINSYAREYFVSADGYTRLTLDTQIKAWNQLASPKPNITFNSPMLDIFVLEIKKDRSSDKMVKLGDILAGFPLRAENYSKYVHSIDALMGW